MPRLFLEGLKTWPSKTKYIFVLEINIEPMKDGIYRAAH
jgi:hypothetical protein